MTDGEENASEQITFSEIIHLINIHESMEGWSFIYVGENPDLWARNTNILRSRIYQFNHDEPESNFNIMSQDVTDGRQN